MSHFIKYCRECRVVIGQCRCPDKNKEVQYGTCLKCLEEKNNKQQRANVCPKCGETEPPFQCEKCGHRFY